MAARPKAKKQKTEKPDKSQPERFRETARAIEADETGKLFEQAFRKLVPPKKAGRRS